MGHGPRKVSSLSQVWVKADVTVFHFFLLHTEEEGYSVNMLLFSFCDQGGVKSQCVCQAPFSKAAVKCTAVPPHLHPRRLGQTRLHWKWTWQLAVSIAYGLYAKWWGRGNWVFPIPSTPLLKEPNNKVRISWESSNFSDICSLHSVS